MKRQILLCNVPVEYELEYKSVKNVNMRVTSDGTLHISASRRHTVREIEALLKRNEQQVIKMLANYERRREEAPEVERFSDPRDEKAICMGVIMPLCEKYYPEFARYCGQFPQIKLRRMKSCWGNCRPQTNILTFNSFLAYVPENCAEYVVVHEFSHFVYANHSQMFYNTVAHFIPDWRKRRAELRRYEIYLK